MIEFEYWQLLFFPLFFALGWAAARIDIRHLVKESRALPKVVFSGAHLCFNEQPDRAIESFVDAVKVDPHTIELHFALGGLFRRRGETERAIRMHQNLVERDDLAAGPQASGAGRTWAGLSESRGCLIVLEEAFNKLKGTEMVKEAKRNLLEICFSLKKTGKRLSPSPLKCPKLPAERNRRVLL